MAHGEAHFSPKADEAIQPIAADIAETITSRAKMAFMAKMVAGSRL